MRISLFTTWLNIHDNFIHDSSSATQLILMFEEPRYLRSSGSKKVRPGRPTSMKYQFCWRWSLSKREPQSSRDKEIHEPWNKRYFKSCYRSITGAFINQPSNILNITKMMFLSLMIVIVFKISTQRSQKGPAL